MSKQKYGRWYTKDHPNAHKTCDHKSKNPTSSPQNMVHVEPSSFITQIPESQNQDPDLLKICSLVGLTMEQLLHKVHGLDPSPTSTLTSLPIAGISFQREQSLRMNCHLLDDYSDSPDQIELEVNMETCDLNPQWLEDCNSLRKSKPRCGACGGHHGPICPLLGESMSNHVSVETVPLDILTVCISEDQHICSKSNSFCIFLFACIQNFLLNLCVFEVYQSHHPNFENQIFPSSFI